MILEIAFNDNCLDFKKQVDALVEEFPVLEYGAYNESHYKKLKN